MNKRSFFSTFLYLFSSLVLMACGGSDSGGSDDSTPSVAVSLSSSSISEGAEVDANTTTSITLNYNTPVNIVSSVTITLNGAKVTAQMVNPPSQTVSIPVELVPGNSYTLQIPQGAFISSRNAQSKSPALTLRFTTKKATTPGDDLPDGTALEMTRKLGWGWNLGNHFDTSSGADGKHPEWGYWDGAKPTKALYENLKKAGASTVRIPVTWGNYQSISDKKYTIEAAYMAEVKQNVEWAEAAGLNVILNLHHDEYWQDIKTAATDATVNDQIKDRITKTWTQIANEFKDKGRFLIFETFNEIQDGQWGWGANRTDGGKQYNTLNAWNQTAVDAIRATGGNNATRWIGVCGYAANPSLTMDHLTLPTDPANRIMVGVHFYDPSSFTLSPYKPNENGKTEWGHTAAAGKYDTGSNEDHVRDIFSKLKAKYIDKNIPCYIGEYGCTLHKTDRSNSFRAYYLEYVCRAAYAYNLPVVIWDNNANDGGGDEKHGYFNHNDGSFLNNAGDLVKTMINATTSTDASYTLEAVYNKAPK